MILERLVLLNIKYISDLIIDILGNENVRVSEPMSRHTSFRVGGPADILVTPRKKEEILSIMDLSKTENIPIYIMGNGSNLIVKDKGIRGIVLKLFDNYNSFSVEGEVIRAQAGLLLSKLSNVALENGLSGLEFASGIPGTVGGAVVMNAGAYGGEMKDVVIKTEYIDKEGNIKTVEGDMHRFGYRTSFVQEVNGVILSSEMRLRSASKSEIKALMDDLTKKRVEKQPLKMPSAGSVFKRPEGYFAGKLIEDCGLRGYKIGGAQVSELHCGFIVNAGNASANDIIKLIDYIKDTVKANFGVLLHTEVKILGED